MKPWTRVRGPAAPLMLENVDTDVIIRVERLAALAPEALGPYAFEALRVQEDGSEIADFVLNQPAFRAAPILLAGANFGCGSSREAAVWALAARGVRCVIAPSFGDIFFANCFQNALLPLRLPLAVIEALARACAHGTPLTVDLERCLITPPDGAEIAFALEAHRREGLLQGLDDIASTLLHIQAIDAWQQADRARRDWAWPAPAPTA